MRRHKCRCLQRCDDMRIHLRPWSALTDSYPPLRKEFSNEDYLGFCDLPCLADQRVVLTSCAASSRRTSPRRLFRALRPGTDARSGRVKYWDTGLRVACLRGQYVHGASGQRPEWPRVTAVGFELPGTLSGFSVAPLDGNRGSWRTPGHFCPVTARHARLCSWRRRLRGADRMDGRTIRVALRWANLPRGSARDSASGPFPDEHCRTSDEHRTDHQRCGGRLPGRRWDPRKRRRRLGQRCAQHPALRTNPLLRSKVLRLRGAVSANVVITVGTRSTRPSAVPATPHT